MLPADFQESDPIMPPPNSSTSKKNAKRGTHTCSMPAIITPDPFATKKQMLDFIAAASEGIVARTKDGTAIVIKI